MSKNVEAASASEAPAAVEAAVSPTPEAPTTQATAEAPAADVAATKAKDSADAPSDSGEAESDPGQNKTLKLKRGESAEAPGSEQPAADANSETADNLEKDGGGNNNRRGRNRRQRRREPSTPSANPLSLTELKDKPTQELIDMAQEMGLENMARSRKQDIICLLYTSPSPRD